MACKLGAVLLPPRAAATVAAAANADVAGEVGDERQAVEGALVDGSDAVVDEVGGEEEGECEDRGIVLRFGVQGADTLGVEEEEAHRAAVGARGGEDLVCVLSACVQTEKISFRYEPRSISRCLWCKR